MRLLRPCLSLLLTKCGFLHVLLGIVFRLPTFELFLLLSRFSVKAYGVCLKWFGDPSFC